MANINQYPYVTKKEIKANIEGDIDYACACIVTLWHRQTEHEQNTESTLTRNRSGFMSSHAVHGSRIAKKILAGEDLSEEDVARVQAIAPRYTKQLAAAARSKALEENPELAAQAAVFGV